MTEMYADFNHAMCSRGMPTSLTKTRSLIDLVPRHFKHRETPCASLLQCTLLSTSVTPIFPCLQIPLYGFLKREITASFPRVA